MIIDSPLYVYCVVVECFGTEHQIKTTMQFERFEAAENFSNLIDISSLGIVLANFLSPIIGRTITEIYTHMSVSTYILTIRRLPGETYADQLPDHLLMDLDLF